MNDLVGRNPDGTWQEGYAPNPEGINGIGRAGFVPWEIRAEQLAEKYNTIEKLEFTFEFSEKGKLVPTKKVSQVHPHDAGILRQMWLAVFGEGAEARHEREAFWNRKEGTPTETLRHEGRLSYSVDPRIIALVAELRSLNASRNAQAIKVVEHSPAGTDNPER